MVKTDQPSDQELEVLSDTNFLSLKESVSKKIINKLASIEGEIKVQIEQSNFSFPEGAFINAGKISKGENYKGLPYFILDFPRLFSRKEVFAFRTMLWWGHEFSSTLHLGGDALKLLDDQKLLKIHQEKDLYFCIAQHPWDYYFEPDNYEKIGDLKLDQIKKHIDSHQFLKISRFIPVSHWNEYKSFTTESFARFLRMLN